MQFGNSAPSQTGIAHQLGIFFAPALAFRAHFGNSAPSQTDGAQPGGHGAQPDDSKEVWVGMRVHHWKTKRAATVAALDGDPNGTHFLLHFDNEWPAATGGMAQRRVAAMALRSKSAGAGSSTAPAAVAADGPADEVTNMYRAWEDPPPEDIYWYRVLTPYETPGRLKQPAKAVIKQSRDDFRRTVIMAIATGNKKMSPFLHVTWSARHAVKIWAERWRMYRPVMVRFLKHTGSSS